MSDNDKPQPVCDEYPACTQCSIGIQLGTRYVPAPAEGVPTICEHCGGTGMRDGRHSDAFCRQCDGTGRCYDTAPQDTQPAGAVADSETAIASANCPPAGEPVCLGCRGTGYVHRHDIGDPPGDHRHACDLCRPATPPSAEPSALERAAARGITVGQIPEGESSAGLWWYRWPCGARSYPVNVDSAESTARAALADERLDRLAPPSAEPPTGRPAPAGRPELCQACIDGDLCEQCPSPICHDLRDAWDAGFAAHRARVDAAQGAGFASGYVRGFAARQAEVERLNRLYEELQAKAGTFVTANERLQAELAERTRERDDRGASHAAAWRRLRAERARVERAEAERDEAERELDLVTKALDKSMTRVERAEAERDTFKRGWELAEDAVAAERAAVAELCAAVGQAQRHRTGDGRPTWNDWRAVFAARAKVAREGNSDV